MKTSDSILNSTLQAGGIEVKLSLRKMTLRILFLYILFMLAGSAVGGLCVHLGGYVGLRVGTLHRGVLGAACFIRHILGGSYLHSVAGCAAFRGKRMQAEGVSLAV